MPDDIHVLVVDDNSSFRMVISKELHNMGFQVETVDNGEEALRRISEDVFDVVLLDIRMPGMDGVAALEAIKEASPTAEVIMLTGYGTVENAIRSMKLGAYDYLTKPCQLDELEVTIRKAYEKNALTRKNTALERELARRDQCSELIGESLALRNVLELIAKAAPTDSTVLIYGESGTGKELVARAIYRHSLRAGGPFVVIDCTSLHENLLESELFGHEKGAYTGATGLKHGLFEVADSGTVFMDEIGELSPAIQAKLLRVLETGSFRRVGGTKNIEVDVRLLAATNRDLRAMMSEEKFKEELFYRLDVVTISVPPLRERKEDIPLLARHFARHNRVTGREKKISEEVMKLLVNYPWPGNVRELENVIERAVILSDGDRITPKDLPGNLRTADDLSLEDRDRLMPLEEVERRYIARVLHQVNGNRRRAARILGISERNLYRKLKTGKVSFPGLE